MKIFELKKEIIAAGIRMYKRGYVAANDGNISARIDDDRILITPTGISKGFMKPADLAMIDFNGKLIKGNRKPSSEFLMHLKIYKNRDDVNSVCHSHPPYSTAFTVAGKALDKFLLPEAVIVLGKVPLIKYETPGTEPFSDSLLPYLKNHDAFLLANHGVVTVGSNVQNAYHKMETVEHFAQILFLALQLGNVNNLNEKEVNELLKLREKFGIRSNIGIDH